jgi:hypothetical protein
MPDKPSQVDRILKAARRFNGVCRVDFQLPDVIDGGKPILNFPGRMYDAEKEGHSFEVIGKRHKCKVFRLVEDSASTAASAGGDGACEFDAGLPGPEYQAGADAAVDAELIPITHKPRSPYEYEREVT